ncbi:hypothetical protein H7T43_18060 [Peribacillus simplex]|nr:hypothetical protein [Peribacillus simplex]
MGVFERITDWKKEGTWAITKSLSISEGRLLAAFWRKGLHLTTRALHIVKKGMDFTIPILFSINKE